MKYNELNKRIEKLEEKFSEHIEHSNDITNKLFSQISLINDNLKKIISNNTEIKNLKASEENNESTENLSEHVNNKEKKHNTNQKDNIYSNSPKSNKKIRGPYKKHNKDDLENSLKYLEIKDSNGNYWKYSLSIFHRNTGTASYRCYDTSCSARGTINIRSNEENLRKFTLKKIHSLEYIDHNYIRLNSVKHDIEFLPKSEIKKKLKDYKYRYFILLELAIQNENFGLDTVELKNFYLNTFGDIKLDLSKLTDNEIDRLKRIFIKKYKLNENSDLDLSKYLTLDYQYEKVKNFIKNKYQKNKNLEELITNIIYEKNMIVVSINIEYKRKLKTYHKKAFIILAPFMIENLTNNNIIQYFTDVTYYDTPTASKKYKILSVLGFDIIDKKTKLCTLALNANENHETYGSIFLYLKILYKYNPKNITSDFNKACISALKHIFPDVRLIPCYFNYIQICYKHLPELKQKNRSLKKMQKIWLLIWKSYAL